MSAPDKRPKRKRRGRPSILTPELLARTASFLPAMLYIETLAGLLEVSRQSIHVWLKRGRAEAERIKNPKAKPKADETIYMQFFYTFQKGMAEGEFNAMNSINSAAGNGIWQAAAWMLERRHPERWGRVERAPVEPATTQPANIVIIERLKEKEPDGATKPDSEARTDSGPQG